MMFVYAKHKHITLRKTALNGQIRLSDSKMQRVSFFHYFTKILLIIKRKKNRKGPSFQFPRKSWYCTRTWERGGKFRVIPM